MKSNVDKLITQLRRQAHQEQLCEAQAAVTHRPAIVFVHPRTGEDAKQYAIGIANLAAGRPVFCCHGKLAGIQCGKCG